MAYKDLRFDRGDGANRTGLADRILKGEVFVFRQALQTFGLFEMWDQATLRGIAKSVGQEAADRAARDGYHRIHEWVSPTDIPPMTDAVYDEVEPLADKFLARFVKGAFPDVQTFYYERSPNVRFHIPFDLAAAHKKEFNKFAEAHGQGKIAAHGPHRDSWLDCAANGMNLWFAMGRVRHGNSLTLYPEDYVGEYKFKRSGDIQDGEKLHKAVTFELEPGDVIMFHTDQVHGSELNKIDETRFVISCRLSIDKPEFPLVHHHHYVYSGWTGSPLLKPVAELPSMLQPSYPKGIFLRARNKLLPSLQPEESKPNPVPTIGRKVGGSFEIPLADLPVGEVKAISGAFCVARISEDEVIALTRRCPHAAGDLVNGWVDGRSVVCPWHVLPFDAETGQSPCKTLPPLKRVACEIRDGVVLVDPKSVLNARQGDEALATAAE